MAQKLKHRLFFYKYSFLVGRRMSDLNSLPILANGRDGIPLSERVDVLVRHLDDRNRSYKECFAKNRKAD
jgi:hypothetical protein